MNRGDPVFEEALSRNKLSHFIDQGYDIHGIVQGGANDGEELESAIRLGIPNYIAFEPLQSAYDRLLQHPMPNGYHCERLGLHNKNTSALLLATDGDGKGASLFESVSDHPIVGTWDNHQNMQGTENIELIRFDTWAKVYEFEPELYDCLQLDTQGNEMEILEGTGEYLKGFKYLCIELSLVPVYVGETPGQEVADWLENQGFILDSPIYEHNDAFFIRKDIKAVSDRIYKGRC